MKSNVHFATCEKVLSGSDITSNMNRCDIIKSKRVELGPSECLSIVEVCSTLGMKKRTEFYTKKSGKFVVLFYKM